jgi:hypothetical protein
VVESLVLWPSPPLMPPSCKPWHAAAICPSSRFSMPASCWPSPPANPSCPLPPASSVTGPPSGVSAAVTSKAVGGNSCWTSPDWDAPRRFPPLQRAQVVQLACLEPIAEGLHITHWTSEDLARQAVADGIVDFISSRTVRRILDDVDLQPHRTRYWRTSRLDEQFKERAEQVLWCYGNAERLARQGIWVVALDEKPNLQVLERDPIRRAVPGRIEQQEFEYTRHGTVNLLFFLTVHTGRMEVAVEAAKDAKHYIEALRAFRRRHRGLKGGVPDPGRRPQPHGGVLVELRGMVATPLHAGARLVAGPGRVTDRRVRLSLPPTRLVGNSGRVDRACVGLRPGVQPTLRAPLRVDLDQPPDATVVRRPCPMNLLHYFCPGPLARMLEWLADLLKCKYKEEKEIRLESPLLPLAVA